MKAQFQDLGITGLIGERCYAIEGSILRIHLRLSDAPPLGWSYLFTQVWQAVDYPGKRPVGIEGDALWIECAPEEVRNCHLPQLEQALDQANERYRAQHTQKEMAAERQRELSRLTHMKLDELARSFAPVPQATEATGQVCEHPRSILGRVLNFLRRIFAPPPKGNWDGRNSTLLRSAAVSQTCRSGFAIHAD